MMPKGVTPNAACEVYKFGVKVNLKRPSDELYEWFCALRDESPETSTVWTDKRTIKFMDALWEFYKQRYMNYLFFSVGAFMMLIVQGFFMPKPYHFHPYATGLLSFIVLGFYAIITPYEIFQIIIRGRKYFLVIHNYINWASIVLNIFGEIYILQWAWKGNMLKEYEDIATRPEAKKHMTNGMDIYCVTVIFSFAKLYFDLMVTMRFRKLHTNMKVMIVSLSSMISLMVIFWVFYTHVFWFGTANVDNTTHLISMPRFYWEHIVMVFDWFFNHFAAPAPTDFWNIVYFVIMSVSMSFVCMKFVISFATINLMKVMPKGDIFDLIIRCQFIIAGMELRRLFMNKNIPDAAQVYEDMDTEVYNPEKFSKPGFTVTEDPDLCDMYIIVEKADGGSKGIDKDTQWKNNMQEIMDNLKTRFELIEDMNKNKSALEAKMDATIEKQG